MGRWGSRVHVRPTPTTTGPGWYQLPAGAVPTWTSAPGALCSPGRGRRLHLQPCSPGLWQSACPGSGVPGVNLEDPTQGEGGRGGVRRSLLSRKLQSKGRQGREPRDRASISGDMDAAKCSFR